MIEMIRQAAEYALPSIDDCPRHYWVGACGIRKDGTTVFARNGAVYTTEVDDNYTVIPQAHAEVRLLRKLGHEGIVFVARVSRKNGQLVMARPCDICQIFLRSKRVNKCYYSINETNYGLYFPIDGTDKVFAI